MYRNWNIGIKWVNTHPPVNQSDLHECAKLCGLRAFVTYVPLRDFLRDLRTFIFLLALRTLIFLTVLHTYMLPYIPAFTFLSVSNF